jgi:hypothetical protein
MIQKVSKKRIATEIQMSKSIQSTLPLGFCHTTVMSTPFELREKSAIPLFVYNIEITY